MKSQFFTRAISPLPSDLTSDYLGPPLQPSFGTLHANQYLPQYVCYWRSSRMSAVSNYDKDIDIEIVDAWERFVQMILGVLALIGAALLAVYSRR